jgi:hypothetical protein
VREGRSGILSILDQFSTQRSLNYIYLIRI